MRLCLLKKDYIRTQIISRKINTKIFNDPELEALKIKYFSLLIQFYFNNSQYLEIAKAYQNIYNTPSILQNQESWTKYLKLLTVFLALSPYDNEVSDLMNRIVLDPKFEKIQDYKDLLTTLLRVEVINWEGLLRFYENKFSQLEEFNERSSSLWNDFRTRIIEHNIRVIAKYYKTVTLKRLSQLLSLDDKETEKYLCKQVTSKVIYAKINRPEGIVNFKKFKTPETKLNEWGTDIKSLLNLVEKGTHYIQRENMIHHIRGTTQ